MTTPNEPIEYKGPPIPHEDFFKSLGYEIGGGGSGPAFWIKISPKDEERQILVSHPETFEGENEGTEGPQGLPGDAFFIGYYVREGDPPVLGVTVHHQDAENEEKLPIVRHILAYFEKML